MDFSPEYVSSGEEEASQLFITQDTYRDDNYASAADGGEEDLFEELSDINFGEPGVVESRDISNVHLGDHSDFSDKDMCSMIFDFTDPKPDSGWTVLSSEDPKIVRRHSDGKIFEIRDSGMVEYTGDPEPIPQDLKNDVERFKDVASDREIDDSKFKR